MLKELKIDLRGLDITDEEAAQILEATRLSIVEILTKKSIHKKNISIVSLGPGWIGIEPDAKDVSE
ncbi:hypothetical protein SOP89_08700 [Pseudomonas siliginis]|uniref:hypothetical protein n=1 Tax=Pseudomonas siliginis TaxID=2842346 RepID=UPI002B254957|nr:hypothetical protein [Pseudomonas siliginis]MEB2651452.1 hypothetical protein [Pseudomonas siliginis]